jgi:dihydrofolate reductase
VSGVRVVAQEWVSLDGYAAGETDESELFEHVPPAADAASMRWNAAFLDEVDAVLLGRHSYEAFLAYWPTAAEPIAPRVNAIDKVVFSTTLARAPWGEHPPARVERDAVSWLRERRDGNATYLVWGSLALVDALLEAGELDQLDLFVAPVVLGRGRPLTTRTTRLEHLTSEPMDGVAHTRYAVRRQT